MSIEQIPLPPEQIPLPPFIPPIEPPPIRDVDTRPVFRPPPRAPNPGLAPGRLTTLDDEPVRRVGTFEEERRRRIQERREAREIARRRGTKQRKSKKPKRKSKKPKRKSKKSKKKSKKQRTSRR